MVALAGVGFWLWPGLVDRGTPRLVVDRTEIDLGDVPYDKMVGATFTLTNAGDGTLRIVDGPGVRAIEGC